MVMEWSNKDLENLEKVDQLRLNPNQSKFYQTMLKFASIGVIPSSKQLLFLSRLAKQSRLEKPR